MGTQPKAIVLEQLEPSNKSVEGDCSTRMSQESFMSSWEIRRTKRGKPIVLDRGCIVSGDPTGSRTIHLLFLFLAHHHREWVRQERTDGTTCFQASPKPEMGVAKGPLEWAPSETRRLCKPTYRASSCDSSEKCGDVGLLEKGWCGGWGGEDKGNCRSGSSYH